MGIWDQLNTKTIEENAGTEIQVQSNPVHLQEQNRQELSDIKLINDATMRDGKAIPATGQVMQFTVSNDTRTTVFTPSKGQVFEIYAMSITANGRSGTLSHNLFFQDVSELSTNSNVMKWHSESLTSSDAVLDDFEASRPMTFDSNLALQYQVTGTFTDSTLNLSVMRVR